MNTLQTLILKLSTHTDYDLVFEHEGQIIQPDYHVTEIKQAHIHSLDCGKGDSEWDEIIIQLLNGPVSPKSNAEYMQAGKFISIVSAAIKSLPDASSAELYFEYSADNKSTERLHFDKLSTNAGSWLIELSPTPASCKPALTRQSMPAIENKGACCGSTREKCCA